MEGVSASRAAGSSPLSVNASRTPPELLERKEFAFVDGDQVIFTIASQWAVPGERRIGYVGILRLVECVRELHWRRDVLPPAAGRPVDCITRSVTAEFLAPVETEARLVGRYRVEWCRDRSYGLQVLLSTLPSGKELVRVGLVCVFYDPVGSSSASPPASVRTALRDLSDPAK